MRGTYPPLTWEPLHSDREKRYLLEVNTLFSLSSVSSDPLAFSGSWHTTFKCSSDQGHVAESAVSYQIPVFRILDFSRACKGILSGH